MRAEDQEPEAQPDEQNKPDKFQPTPEEAEDLRKRCFDLRSQGLSFDRIAAAIGKSRNTARTYWQQARAERMKQVETEGWKPKVGEAMRKNERHYELAMLHFQHLTTQPEEPPILDEHGKVVKKGKKAGLGTVAAAIWMQTILKIEKQGLDLLMDVGVIPRASEKLDVTITDARSMSLEELQIAASRLRKQLANGEIVPDSIAQIPIDADFQQPILRKARTLDAKVVKTVDKAAEAIEESSE